MLADVLRVRPRDFKAQHFFFRQSVLSLFHLHRARDRSRRFFIFQKCDAERARNKRSQERTRSGSRSHSSSPRAVPAPAAPPPTTPAPVLAEPPPLLPAGVVQPPANIERPVAAPAAAVAPHDDPMEEDD